MTCDYKNPALPPERRACDLVSIMTTDEKLDQMAMTPLGSKDVTDILTGGKPEHEIGAVYFTTGYLSPDELDKIQRYQVDSTRLGIPLLVMGESIHGIMSPGATVFPQAIGLGATFDTELISKIAEIIGAEARSSGIRQVYAPDIDLSREPRWGRVEENYGEDPYLTSRLCVAYIKALQSAGVAATVKHYIAHGSPEGGVNIAPVHFGLREFYEVIYETFNAAVGEAGALSVMPAYGEFDGEPIHSSRFLLTEVLREKMGFKGFTVSDFGATSMLVGTHCVAADEKEAGFMALNAGLDFEAPGPFAYGGRFREAVHNGEIAMSLVDEAVKRILYVKFALGLFEEPFVRRSTDKNGETARELALRAGVESIVLLENNGVLPLSETARRVAVVGPNADDIRLGDYSMPDAHTRVKTLRTVLAERLGSERIVYSPGCNIASGTAEMISSAVEAVRGADVVIAVIGDNSDSYAGIGWGDQGGGGVVTCGEGRDSASLELPDAQLRLLRALRPACGKLITVLETGRPYDLREIKELSDALIAAWYPGELGGYALYDILFGRRSPSGRLPITFPRSVGHLPCYYNYKVSARGYYKNPGSDEHPGNDYVFDTPAPLYSFGYGLSYTQFDYSELAAVVSGREVTVSVKVKNIGKHTGDEIVLLFLRHMRCRITPFIKRLRGFTRISLAPGEEKTVSFKLSDSDFTFINERYEPEPGYGTFRITISDQTAEFTL